jgi:hypothetical protein
MLHTGIALELSRLLGEDRRANATARRRGRSTQTSPGARVDADKASDRSIERPAPTPERRIITPTDAPEDLSWAWRVVEPDAEYLRHRAA